ncbi:MAG: FAD-dependent oxidoreductase [Telluria sp.]
MTTPWHPGWRATLPDLLTREYDVLVVGGGITGAGILLEAARRGLKALLVEQRDFAWGTSSRSSKLVHGGLRYLKEGRLGLTRESVHERERLLREAPGLVTRQGFAFGDYAGRKPGRRTFQLGLAMYDLLAGVRSRHAYDTADFLMMAPNVARDGLRGGLCYADAKTDDARLVLRVLQEAQAHGGVAVNYTPVRQLVRAGGKVTGARVADAVSGAEYLVAARVVINATGAWADGLHGQVGAAQTLRPLRGSHLVLPAWRLPLAQAISLMHPRDGRPVFAFPWEGVTLVGTTDVDHRAPLEQEAAITRAEFDYLLEALHTAFPGQGLQPRDVIATYAGVRPVIDTGAADPSKETREHAVYVDEGMVTVTGGKLTTFRVIALDALRKAAPQLPGWEAAFDARPVFSPGKLPPAAARLPSEWRERLRGRHGRHAADLVGHARKGELARIPGTETLWAELRQAARAEAVEKLEDLLLRRTRLGLQLPRGGAAHFDRIRALCQHELGWDDQRWDAEAEAYLALWNTHYGLPADYA